MDDQIPSQPVGPIQIGHTINLAKAKLPMIMPTTPPELTHWIGMVALAWSDMEVWFNRFLSKLIKANGTIISEWWPYYPFDSRLDKLKKQSKICFHNYESISAYVSSFAIDCEELQLKRNTLLHGEAWVNVTISGTIGNPTVKTSIETRGRKNGNLSVLVMDADDLESLFYDICHLGGRIMSLTRDPGEPIDGLSSQDISFLRGLPE